MYCIECGTKNPDAAKFCANCGGAIAVSTARAQVPPPAQALQLTPTAKPIVVATADVDDIDQVTAPAGRHTHTEANPLPWLLLGSSTLFTVWGLLAASDTQVFLFGAAFLSYYLLIGHTLMSTARRLDVGHRWRAWLPLLQVTLMIELAQVSLWVLLFFCVPILNLLVIPFLWTRILPKLSMSSWWAIGLSLPLLNAPMLAYVSSRDNTSRTLNQDMVPPLH